MPKVRRAWKVVVPAVALAAATTSAATAFADDAGIRTVEAGGPAGSADAGAPSGGPAHATGQAEVQRGVRALEVEYDARIGAYAIDTGTGRAVGHRADALFPMASTFKAMACAAALHEARTEQPGLMQRLIRYTEADLAGWSPVTEDHVDTGMTVSELCHATITMSDNTAGNLVLRQLGGPAGFTDYLRSLGDPRSRLDRWEPELNDWQPGERRDTTTPAEMARNLQAVAVGSALTEPDRNQLVEWLRAARTGQTRIRAGLPADWVVGDKTGTGGTYATAHDIAVVWPADGGAPIVMAVYTNRHTPEAAVDDAVVARTATVLAQGLGRLD